MGLVLGKRVVLPDNATLPDHAPSAAHETVLAVIQAKVTGEPATTVRGNETNLTFRTGVRGGAAATAIVTLLVAPPQFSV